LIDGKPAECVYHWFERQINFRLSLSFIDCTPIAESDYKPARRSPELVEEQRRYNAREFGEEDNPVATDLDEQE
jgi:hypothetical protein